MLRYRHLINNNKVLGAGERETDDGVDRLQFQ